MSTKPYKGFEPKWVLTRAPENSYRSIFRWGDPDFFKYPKEALYHYVKERCNLAHNAAFGAAAANEQFGHSFAGPFLHRL